MNNKAENKGDLLIVLGNMATRFSNTNNKEILENIDAVVESIKRNQNGRKVVFTIGNTDYKNDNGTSF